jgi:hypothetical protein
MEWRSLGEGDQIKQEEKDQGLDVESLIAYNRTAHSRSTSYSQLPKSRHEASSRSQQLPRLIKVSRVDLGLPSY